MVEARIETIQLFDLAEPQIKSQTPAEDNIYVFPGPEVITWSHTGRYSTESARRFSAIAKPNGEPWIDGCLFLISHYEDIVAPPSDTIENISRDLLAFYRWSQNAEIDYLDCSDDIRMRLPTYRFTRFLRKKIETGQLKVSTAKRRVNVMVRFYRYLQKEGLVTRTDLWRETKNTGISLTNEYAIGRPIITTDLSRSLKNVRAKTPTHETIIDGRELHPLTREETRILRYHLAEIGNTEMELAFDIALMTGARIGTAFTIRVGSLPLTPIRGLAKIFIGGTELVRSKNDTEMVLFIPNELVQRLHIYSASERAANRQKIRQHEREELSEEYLFITTRGRPYYCCNRDLPCFVYESPPAGNAISQFIRQTLRPRLIKSGFTRRLSFHDLRATFGVRFLEMQIAHQLKCNPHQAPQDAYFKALNILKNRMGHAHFSTTEQYLDYVLEHSVSDRDQGQFEQHLLGLIDGDYS